MKTTWIVLLLLAACHGGMSPTTGDAPPTPDAGVDAAADAPADAPVSPFTFVPDSLDFGYVGTTGAATSPQYLRVSAIGTYPGFSISLSGDSTDAFHILTTSCTSTLSGGGCEMYVEYTPLTLGDHTMTVTASAPGQIPATAQIHAIGGDMPHPFGAGLPFLDFGTLTVGELYGKPVTFHNHGTTTLPAVSFMFSGESPDQWQLTDDHCTGVQLAPGATCTVTVVYAPTAMVPGAAVLYGTAFDTDEIDLRADPKPATTLSISPANHDFGTVGSSPSASYPFTITNTGSAATTAITATMGSTQFAITSSTCGSLAPGDTCEIDVRAAPTSSTGPIGSSITVAATNSTTVDAGFTATAIPAEGVILDTWSHDFGSTAADTIGSNYTFTVTNVGTVAQPLSLSLDSDAAAFTLAQDNCSATTLAAGSTCTFEIVFTPKMVATSHFARVHVTSSSNDAIAHLTGISTPGDQPLNIGGFNFSTDAIGQIIIQQFLIVHEGGTVKVPTMSLLGPNASEFSMVNDTCTGTTLSVSGDSCTVDVWYRPATVGTKLAYLKADWGAGSAQGELDAGAFQVADPFVTSDPPSLDFGTIGVGTSKSLTLPYKNFGTATSAPVAFQLGGINPADFSLTNDSCTGVALAHGDTCSVTVVFTPGATGTRHSDLQVAVPGGNDAKLTGVGQ